jgi:ribonuclease P/MRP protein subunit POP7
LRAGDVEREIVSENALAGGAVGGDGQGEKVYLKATGRAIPRALELGVGFQGEADCVVRVEMGSVKAIDDIEVRDTGEDVGAEEGGVEVPETRIRTVSSVTVSIGLK